MKLMHQITKRIVGCEASKYFFQFIHILYSQFYSSQFYKHYYVVAGRIKDFREEFYRRGTSSPGTFQN